MAVAATCECGQTFTLKDEFAGQLLKCPSCQRTMTAGPVQAVGLNYAAPPHGDGAFALDKYLMRQKVMSINQKYFVGDEQNRPVLYVERPAYALKQLLAMLCAIAAFFVISGAISVLTMTVLNSQAARNSAALPVMMVAALVLGIVAAVAVAIVMSPKRHVTFYRDESKSEPLLTVFQDAKFQLINWTFTVKDRDGSLLCNLHKNVLYNFFRKRWYVLAPDGSVMWQAMEDSIVLSLLRRFLGPLFGLLRTNFIICPPNSDAVVGEFNRKLTLFDRYVMDLSHDRERRLDRRIALALGVMLDTGERR